MNHITKPIELLGLNLIVKAGAIPSPAASMEELGKMQKHAKKSLGTGKCGTKVNYLYTSKYL